MFRYIFFAEKNVTRGLRKNYTGLLPAARRAADCRFLSYLACGSFHLVSVFYKGKKSITSDALFADLWQRFCLFYRNPAFLSPLSLRDTSPELRFVKFFQRKNLTRFRRKIKRRDNRVRAACAAKSRFSLPLCPVGQSSLPFRLGASHLV